MGEMKSFSVSPGRSVFIKASPMRKPRKPAARRLRIVSGCEMPLSETSMGILRTSEPYKYCVYVNLIYQYMLNICIVVYINMDIDR